MDIGSKHLVAEHPSNVSLMLKKAHGNAAGDWSAMYDRIGNNIRTLRTYSKFTQEYMARELDISTSAYGKLERNESEITVKRLFQVAVILGVSIELLIYLEANQITVYHEHKEI